MAAAPPAYYASLSCRLCQAKLSPPQGKLTSYPDFYKKHFGKDRPDRVVSIEERVRERAAKKAKRRQRRAGNVPQSTGGPDARATSEGPTSTFMSRTRRLGNAVATCPTADPLLDWSNRQL